MLIDGAADTGLVEGLLLSQSDVRQGLVVAACILGLLFQLSFDFY